MTLTHGSMFGCFHCVWACGEADGCGRANLLTSWLPESTERDGQMNLCESTEGQERSFKSLPPTMTYFLQQDFVSYTLHCF